MNLEESIRKFAKNIENQNLFLSAKDLNCIKLFNNDNDYSQLQHLFLSYLYFYHNLYTEIGMKEVSEKVLEDTIYEDAYMVYKKNKPEKKSKIDNKKSSIHLIFPKQKSKRK